MNIGITEIKNLREKTGAGMMDCKEALTESNGDVEKAILVLRKKGLADIKKREGKKTSEGTIGKYFHPGNKLAALVEVNAETDFVSKGELFHKFADDIAMHVAAVNPQWVSRDQVPQHIIDREKEIMSESLVGKPPQVIEKIVEGKLNKFFKETCLMDQEYVKDSNLTITDLMGDLASKVGEKIVIKWFVRRVVGEKQ